MVEQEYAKLTFVAVAVEEEVVEQLQLECGGFINVQHHLHTPPLSHPHHEERKNGNPNKKEHKHSAVVEDQFNEVAQ
jgi:hypothetical protein